MEWAIGKGYDLFAEGTGKLIMPGEKMSWDQHLHAVGEEVDAGSEIALWLYPKGQEPKKRSYLIGFTGLKKRGFLDIAPNSMAYTEGFTVLKENTMITNFQPHFHLRGKAMEVKAILPDGGTQVVSYVGKFNFNWMTNYIYADDAAPVFPKGTVIQVSAWYDNTKNNPNNPDPDQWVGYGDRTVDEMAHAWMNVVYLTDAEYKEWHGQEEGPGHRRQPAAAIAMRHRLAALALFVSAWAIGLPAQQISEPLRGFGASITAAYEGWFNNADGTHNFLIGYYNRNNTQAVDVPIGPNNTMGPNGPDLGQPTHFLPGRQTGVFIVTMPKEFGAKDRVTWSITVNNQTTSIPFWMNELYEVSPFADIAVGNKPPVIKFDATGPTIQGPDRHGRERRSRARRRWQRDCRSRCGRRMMRSIRADRMRRSAILPRR